MMDYDLWASDMVDPRSWCTERLVSWYCSTSPESTISPTSHWSPQYPSTTLLCRQRNLKASSIFMVDGLRRKICYLPMKPFPPTTSSFFTVAFMTTGHASVLWTVFELGGRHRVATRIARYLICPAAERAPHRCLTAHCETKKRLSQDDQLL
jgi:hypothetical protein